MSSTTTLSEMSTFIQGFNRLKFHPSNRNTRTWSVNSVITREGSPPLILSLSPSYISLERWRSKVLPPPARRSFHPLEVLISIGRFSTIKIGKSTFLDLRGLFYLLEPSSKKEYVWRFSIVSSPLWNKSRNI